MHPADAENRVLKTRWARLAAHLRDHAALAGHRPGRAGRRLHHFHHPLRRLMSSPPTLRLGDHFPEYKARGAGVGASRRTPDRLAGNTQLSERSRLSPAGGDWSAEERRRNAPARADGHDLARTPSYGHDKACWLRPTISTSSGPRMKRSISRVGPGAPTVADRGEAIEHLAAPPTRSQTRATEFNTAHEIAIRLGVKTPRPPTECRDRMLGSLRLPSWRWRGRCARRAELRSALPSPARYVLRTQATFSPNKGEIRIRTDPPSINRYGFAPALANGCRPLAPNSTASPSA